MGEDFVVRSYIKAAGGGTRPWNANTLKLWEDKRGVWGEYRREKKREL